MQGLNYSQLLEQWRAARQLIDAAIERWLIELPEANAVDAARYIAMGGKRLRGFLVLEVARSLGAQIEEALDAAVAVELVHAASLALDDIIDEDLVRRGAEAAWVKYGLKKTVMVSNLLIPFAQKIVAERYGEEALRRTVRAWLDISRGEVIDAFTVPEQLSPDTYLEMIRLKTGALFRLAAELGVIAAGRHSLIDVASRYGETIGIMYQIADDLRDSRDKEKVKNEPSLQLFLRWLNGAGINKAYTTIKILLARAVDFSTRIAGSMHNSYLSYLPRFIVNAMLGGSVA
ncbi:MAG TPA: polyprenyl synthetase family protein [Pyrodictium delaneyi]|uniref:Polyprenyl synthetase family protein n=1 Tax=Pyrodictium delaneyi TaxID=1273541 RepID=A0A833EB43_9CREN|nr:polyprenyl synthetase family protein [Pyrodictium delaneyi]